VLPATVCIIQVKLLLEIVQYELPPATCTSSRYFNTVQSECYNAAYGSDVNMVGTSYVLMTGDCCWGQPTNHARHYIHMTFFVPVGEGGVSSNGERKDRGDGALPSETTWQTT
jgi:hypothetical protein